MDINALELFWPAIALIRIIIFIANFDRANSDSALGNKTNRDCNTQCRQANSTNFDLMTETK